MSKSLTRVKTDLERLGLALEVFRVSAPTHTAAQAAKVIGCEVNQIVKSILFLGQDSGQLALFLTPGGQRVDLDQARALANEPLGKADAAIIRARTGFAIGGVSPFGHLIPPRPFMEPALLAFPRVWAAAGTPHHMFEISPQLLAEKTAATLAPFGT